MSEDMHDFKLPRLQQLPLALSDRDRVHVASPVPVRKRLRGVPTAMAENMTDIRLPKKAKANLNCSGPERFQNCDL
jgi:hypothetical protein